MVIRPVGLVGEVANRAIEDTTCCRDQGMIDLLHSDACSPTGALDLRVESPGGLLKALPRGVHVDTPLKSMESVRGGSHRSHRHECG